LPVAGNGLRGMRERLAAYGGEVDADTAPGQGFTLRLRLPLDDVADIAVSTAEPAGPPAPITEAT
jgi:signal transduction histidine kinase